MEEGDDEILIDKSTNFRFNTDRKDPTVPEAEAAPLRGIVVHVKYHKTAMAGQPKFGSVNLIYAILKCTCT